MTRALNELTSAQNCTLSHAYTLAKHIVKTKRIEKEEEEEINTLKKEAKNNLQKEWKKKEPHNSSDSNRLDNILLFVF